MTKKYAFLPLHRAEQGPPDEAGRHAQGCGMYRLFLAIVALTCRIVDRL